MEIKDALGIGKVLPVEKLTEILSKAVGRISKSYFDKKDAQSKAYEIKALADAKAYEMKVLGEAIKENAIGTGGIEYKEQQLQISSSKDLTRIPDIDLSARIDERILFQDAQRQINLESITAIAADQLKDEGEIESDPIDQDWFNKFFRYSEDISNEEMQKLWGKILAGEILRPKSFSLRTLEIIRNLSKEEADIITKVANFCINANHDYFLFKGDDNAYEKYNISSYDIFLLTELGILQSGSFLTFRLSKTTTGNKTIMILGKKILVVERQPNSPEVFIPIEIFTSVGKQILKLLDIDAHEEYFNEYAKYLAKKGDKVFQGSIIDRIGDMIKHTPLVPFID
jgi:hypothetical protein